MLRCFLRASFLLALTALLYLAVSFQQADWDASLLFLYFPGSWPELLANFLLCLAWVVSAWLVACTIRNMFLYNRGWRRHQRNLCPHCAYPMGASGICSECGKRVGYLPGIDLPAPRRPTNRSS